MESRFGIERRFTPAQVCNQMLRLILHAGMPKTGSTSIQRFLKRDMQDRRFLSIGGGRKYSGNRIVGAFSDNPRGMNRNRKRALSSGDLDSESSRTRAEFRADLAAADEVTGIFSSELLGQLGAGETAAFLQAIREEISAISVVAYIRSPRSFMESAFQQRLKAGSYRLQPRRLYPGYRARFSALERDLGPASIAYWLFDPRVFPGGCVVRDFCSRLGITVPEDFRAQARNVSLSLPALRLLYAYRRFGAPFGVGSQAIAENMRLIRSLSDLRGPKLRLHGSLVDGLLDRRSDDISWVERRLGVSFDEEIPEDEHALHEENELLNFSASEIDWLGNRIGSNLVLPGNPEIAGQRVAAAVHKLRLDS